MTFLINNVALLALLAAPGPATGELREALLGPSPDRVDRIGARSPAARLETALHSRDRLTRIAAARAAPSCEDAWLLLLPLARMAGEPDRSIAAEAARAAVAIANRLDRERAMREEIPDDDLRERLIAWRRVAAGVELWPDVRVFALEIGAHLRAALGSDALPEDIAYDRSQLFADPEPEVRRAALELTPFSAVSVSVDAIAERVINDESDTVALVAAQVLCAGTWFGDSPDAALAGMGEKGIARVRRLVSSRSAPAAAVLDAARCLAADGSPESKAALERLAARGAKSIRRRARGLIRKAR